MSQPSTDIARDWITLRYAEAAAFTETYGFSGSQGFVNLEAVLLRPAAQASNTLLVYMHPSVTQHGLPVPQSLPALGFHVLCATNRYVKNDSALIMEKVLLDLGAWIRHAKDVLGYKRIVLCGWSGGGPLMLFYQSQAERPTITDTPAGDPVNVKGAGLVPADAVIFQAASISRAHILVEAIDPSVRNELDPDDRDVTLDIYDPRNPNTRPYSPDFIRDYRAAQYRRVQRIAASVKETLAELKRRNTGEMERGFVTHRTLADPRFVDPTVDPNDRKPGVCYVGNPETANNGPVGLGRFSTLRSWLSQWSIDDTRANGLICAPQITVPFLAIENSADDGAPQPHVGMVFNAAGAADKTMRVIKGANHYYAGQPELLAQANMLIREWLGTRNLI
jgi:pimeloyl-ACP methyl ester carboxylesterase